MNKSDFNFELPEALIAQYPLAKRTDSRLLSYDRQTKATSHHQFKDITDFLKPNDLLVFNNSKVIPARLYGTKATGGKIEFLVERLDENDCFYAHIKASKSPKPGTLIYLSSDEAIEVLAKDDDLYFCKALSNLDKLLEKHGHMPLPPYITRSDDEHDAERYQTVYAKHKGSVAAPTAGLHFDDELLRKIQEKGIKCAFVTLHVGAGTFRPVRTESILEHKMHSEFFQIDEELCKAVNETKAKGGRVIAVGTTALRSLESAVDEGGLQPQSQDTAIFIYPGYQFKICDGLITNFHLPESTLVMLVSAFIGHAETMSLYQEAIKNEYRFFSYGDASILL
ncbi:MAG: tRNA preQ1(34) S-adenosylmethionine ribosyltransferase-isomerase QueA [Proteobacteria bacterium]|nr:tRNA preQ1(34) S-adenosylmethionine ribosyltransferase-isomerase QueA [Pseudomonadota bacterium]